MTVVMEPMLKVDSPAIRAVPFMQAYTMQLCIDSLGTGFLRIVYRRLNEKEP